MSASKLKKKLVSQILNNYPETRADDKLLYLKVFEYLGFNFTENQKHLFLSSITSLESYRRTRQKLQQEGHFLPPQDVIQKRKTLSTIYKKELKKPVVYFDKQKQTYILI